MVPEGPDGGPVLVKRGQHPAFTSKDVGASPEHRAMHEAAFGAVVGGDLFIEHAPHARLWACVSSGVVGLHIFAHGSPALTPHIAQPSSETHSCKSLW